MPTRGAVATGSSPGLGKFVNDDEVCPLHALDHKLGNPVTSGDLRSDHPIVVDQVHQDFAAVTGVDGARRVQYGHAQPSRQSGARVHQADVSIREGDGHTGADQRPLAGSELEVFGGHEVGTGVSRMCVRRQRQIGVEPPDVHRQCLVHMHHPAGCDRPPDTYPRSVAQTYRERLTVAWWLWLPALGLAALLAAEVYLGAPGGATWIPYLVLLPVTVVGLWWLGRIRVAVTDDELLVDDARLPLRFVAGATVLDANAKRDLLGPHAEPYAFVIQRPWIGRAVQVRLNDPADPTPYWIISSRHPEELAQAISPR